MTSPGISIVVPAYNEEKFLPASLISINQARAHFESATGLNSEVIVVNNDSTDATARVAREHSAVVVDHSVRNIASVRNAGIRSANYDLVVTIDADSFLPLDGLVKIRNFMGEGGYSGGALGVKVISNRIYFRVAAVIVQTFVNWLSGIYGAMFFFRKDVALEIGGFPETHLVAEDMAFALAMHRYAQEKGMKFGKLKSVQVGTLDRKDFDPRAIFVAAIQALRAFRGAKQNAADLDYWYSPKR